MILHDVDATPLLRGVRVLISTGVPGSAPSCDAFQIVGYIFDPATTMIAAEDIEPPRKTWDVKKPRPGESRFFR